MATNVPCDTCSWNPERQDSCRYHSHVKLLYGVSDRGVWSLGSQFILKGRGTNPPNFEAENIRFLKEKTSIPLPTVVEDWKEVDGRYFMLTKRIHGEPLNDVWPILPAADRERIAEQTAEYLLQLRDLHSPRMQSVSGQPIYSALLFLNGYGVPHGPLSLQTMSSGRRWPSHCRRYRRRFVNAYDSACPRRPHSPSRMGI